MEKRYQVFISSTFQDLQEARNAVLQSLLKMRHIPAGMELFPAIDEEQMLYIRKVIDESDYYLLIIGGRYGSLSAKGVSYTEDEYDYAVKTGKPVLAFIHENPDELPAKDTERNPALQEKLKAFCEKVKTGRRIVRFWRDVKDLRAEVAESLPQTITARPAIGWVRGDKAEDTEITKKLAKTLEENASLKTETEKLKTKLGQNKTAQIDDIAGLDYEIPSRLWHDNIAIQNSINKPTWESLFLDIAKNANLLRNHYTYSEEIRQYFSFNQSAWELICIQYEELGLIKIDSDGDWMLTAAGERLIRNALVIRKPKTQTAEKE